MEGHLSLKFPGTIKPLEELNFPEIDFTIENVVTQRIVRSIKRWHSSSVAAGQRCTALAGKKEILSDLRGPTDRETPETMSASPWVSLVILSLYFIAI